MTTSPHPRTFALEVTEYLQRTPRQLPSKYFYDALGSALFDAICRLPWYRITRAESALLARHGREILAPMPGTTGLVELGCGNGEKIMHLVDAGGAGTREVALVDISRAALESASDRLTAAGLRVQTYLGTYDEGLARLAAQRGDAAAGTPPILALFLGSNIGNFDPPAARDLLCAIRRALRPGDALLLGSDLVKPIADLLLAYDDPLQVTAAFNRNLLRRVNDELGGTFDLDGFAHRAVWNEQDSRVEMHLVSVRRQTVRVAAADTEVSFERDEWIWTESSYKYTPEQVLEQGRAAGFAHGTQWIDAGAGFALTRFSVDA